MYETTVSLKLTAEGAKTQVPPDAVVLRTGLVLAREKHSRRDQGLKYHPLPGLYLSIQD